MSGLNVWGCTGNLEHTQHLIEKGGVLEMFCRINLDYFEGYTVTGVTHGHDGHTSSRASGCWDSLGCPYGIFFVRDPWKRAQNSSRLGPALQNRLLRASQNAHL